MRDLHDSDNILTFFQRTQHRKLLSKLQKPDISTLFEARDRLNARIKFKELKSSLIQSTDSRRVFDSMAKVDLLSQSSFANQVKSVGTWKADSRYDEPSELKSTSSIVEDLPRAESPVPAIHELHISVSNEQQKDMYQRIVSKVGKMKSNFSRSIAEPVLGERSKTKSLLERNRLTTKIQATSKDMLLSAASQTNSRLDTLIT